MSWEILKEWETKAGYFANVGKLSFGFAASIGNGHHCGYVDIPKTHPLYGKEYNDCVPELKQLFEKQVETMTAEEGIEKFGIINLFCSIGWDDEEGPRVSMLIPVHGGITYSAITTNGMWRFGFDCGHLDDNLTKCDVDYCVKECEQMAEKLKAISLED